ncbi:MAG: site-specific integrase [Deltaproteobacteria bacterium]|nr:site-specific integrase [Deltaproteobacteria bacterium]
MKGSIQKKGKKYYAVIALNGKRKWFKGGKRKEAERVLAEKITEINQGTYKEIPKMTFKEYAETWIKSYAETNLKPSTLALYEIIIDKHLIPQWVDYRLNDIKAAQIQSYASERLKKVSPKTVRNEVALLKQMFKHAYQWGYTKTNQTEHVLRPRIEKREIELLGPEEIDKLLKHATGAYKIAFLTAIMTGMRAGELWGLQWCDVDWNSNQIYVRRSLWGEKFQTPKSKASIRKIDIPSSLSRELKKWRLACPISKDDLVFSNTDGKRTNHNTVIKSHFNPALRRAGLRHVSFHSLRHSNASMRIQAGQNIKYLSTQLGHSSINITMDRYGHLFNDVDFTKRQVDLLETSFQSVRNRLEMGNKKGLEEINESPNPSVSLGAEAGI